MRSLILATALLFMVLLLPLQAQASTYIINPDGSGDFATIQQALYAAIEGDVVQLADGVFTGPGNRDLDTNETVMTIESQSGDPSLCIIDCQGTSGDPHFGIEYVALGPGAILRGITITNGYGAEYGGALRLVEASIVVEDCVFSDNSALNFGGAVYASEISSTFLNCEFRNNSADYYGKGGAIFTQVGGPLTFEGCTFQGNQADYGGALYADDAGEVAFTLCLFSENSAGHGGVISAIANTEIKLYNSTLFRNSSNFGSAVYLQQNALCRVNSSIIAFGRGGAACSDDGYGSYIIGCTDIFGNQGGDWVGDLVGQGTINNNANVDPQFCDPMGNPTNFSIMSGSPVGDSHPCGFLGAKAADPGWPAPIYVLSADGQGMFSTIQTAVDAVPFEAVITLVDGTYTGEGNHDIDFSGKAVSLTSISQNSETVIIDLQGSEANQRRGFWLHSNETPATAISHLTIRNGLTYSGSSMPFPGQGSAILITDSSKLTVLDVAFDNNRADLQGGVIRVIGTGASLDLRDSRFTFNYSNFCILASSCKLVMDNCDINEGNLGGIFLEGEMSQTVISNSQLRSVGLEGMKFQDVHNTVTVENCAFVARAGVYGMSLSGSTNVVFNGCSFGSLSSSLAADAVDIDSSTVSFSSCSFTKHEPDYEYCTAVNSSASFVSFHLCSFSDFVNNTGTGTVNSVGGSLSLDECVFANNGNGVSHTGNASSGISILHTSFTGQQEYCIDIDNVINQVMIHDCEIANSATGILLNDLSNFRIQYSVFNSNPAGRTVAIQNSTGDVDNCQFTGNTCNTSGGAIFSLNSDVDLMDSSFSGNSSGAKGGAIHYLGGSAILSDCHFANNTAARGGGFYADGCNMTMNDCTFTENSAIEYGGSIFTESSVSNLIQCVISEGGTTEGLGGGSYHYGGTTSYTSGRIENNAGYHGGGISTSGGTVTLTNVHVIGNSGVYGGGLEFKSGNVSLSDCTVVDNYSGDHGGIYIYDSCNAEIYGTLIAGNTALLEASGITASMSSTVNIHSSTIVGNHGEGSTGQVFSKLGGEITLNACIVAFNPTGPASAIGDETSTITAQNSDVFGNAGGDWSGPLAGQAGVACNFSLDPLFCDQVLGDFHLYDTSPCAADNNPCGILVGTLGVQCSDLSPVTESELPRSFAVLGNHPNPFNPRTDISFVLSASSPVVVEIFDLAGGMVRCLVPGDTFPAGKYQVTWDGTDEMGQAQSSGIYLYRVQAEGQNLGGKMAMIR